MKKLSAIFMAVSFILTSCGSGNIPAASTEQPSPAPVVDSAETELPSISDLVESASAPVSDLVEVDTEPRLLVTIGETEISGAVQNKYDGKGNHIKGIESNGQYGLWSRGSWVSFDGEWYYFCGEDYLYRADKNFNVIQQVSNFYAEDVRRHQNLLIAGDNLLSDGNNVLEIINTGYEFIMVGEYMYCHGYRCKLDGTGKETLVSVDKPYNNEELYYISEHEMNSFYVNENAVYYSDNEGIYEFKDNKSRLIVEAKFARYIVVEDDMIYYIEDGTEAYYGSYYDRESSWSYATLTQYNIKNGEKKVLADNAMSYNMIGDKLFYSGKVVDSALYSVDLKTYKTNRMLEVPARNINICNDKIFFTIPDRDDKEIYVCNFDGSGFKEIKYMDIR